MGSQVLASTQHTTRYRCCVYLLSRRPNKQNFKMKISLVLSLLGLSACSASPQFGFLGQLFGGGRNRGRQNNRNRPSGGGGGGRCGGGNQPNHQFQGQGYLVSWRLGCSSFTQGGGESFCRSNGMRPISLDSSAKEREFLGLVSSEGQKYFWTGGKVRGRSISWPSGPPITMSTGPTPEVLVLHVHSQITEKGTRSAWRSSITSTMMASGSTTCHATTASPSSARPDFKFWNICAQT